MRKLEEPSIQFRLSHVLVFVTVAAVLFGVGRFLFTPYQSGCVPPLYPCRGIVTLDGEPLSNASLRFETQQKHFVARSDNNGAFALFTPQGPKLYPGGPMGTYKVAVRLLDEPFDSRIDPTSPIPVAYQSFTTSCLMIEIPNGGTEDVRVQIYSAGNSPTSAEQSRP